MDKISNIRSVLDTNEDTTYTFTEKVSPSRLDNFPAYSIDDIESIIAKTSNSSCDLDPIPTALLKRCMPAILPFMTYLVNLSLESGQFPTALKTALVRPLLKKPNLDKNEMKNFRPVSNISFASKIIEKAVTKHLDNYMTSHSLHEKHQSAYRRNHGTETALVKLHDDILRSLDKREGVILVMLDLSAAFDTIDHDILVERMRTRLGVEGSALKWIRDYHTDRKQLVVINMNKSSPLPLRFGAPQGSIVGPEDYKIYTLPVGDIVRKYDLTFNGYADDSSNHISFQINSESDFANALHKVASSTDEVKAWMTQNKLKLNDTKTEVVIFVPPASSVKYQSLNIRIADAHVTTTDVAKSLGILMDTHLSPDKEIESRCRIMLYHLRRIRSIRRFVTQSACEKLIHALVSSRLDYANAILVGLSKKKINRLQMIQNMAARVVTNSRKYDHITPILISLHWLPVKYRIDFKILTLTFKIIQGNAPEYMCDLISLRCSDRRTRSSTRPLLVVPKSRTKTFGDRAFSVASPRLWNVLPPTIQCEHNYERFKRNLKTHLFKQAYSL